MSKYIILDRDGVINFDSADYIKSPEEWHPIPGSLEAIADLNKAGYKVFVATNQSGIGRGYFDLATLEAIHSKMQTELQKYGGEIQDIFYCPHLPTDDCQCRKPKPGLLLQIAQQYNIELSSVCFIGDSMKDLQAAKAAGCKGVLVRTGNGAATQADLGAQEVSVYSNLQEFAHNLPDSTKN